MISVIIPALNEEKAISRTIGELKAVLEKANIQGSEILVVNDGSDDDTEKLARSSGARVISHPHNIGYGRSLKDGIQASENDTIVIIDADLTYPADAIVQLLAEYNNYIILFIVSKF